MQYVVGLVVAALVVVSCQATPFNTCRNIAAPKAVRVYGCNKLPCRFKGNTWVQGEVDFVLPAHTTWLNSYTSATLYGKTIPYSIPQNGCKSLIRGGKCNNPRSQVVTYYVSHYIDNKYPSTNVEFMWSLYDQKKQYIVCAKLPIQLYGTSISHSSGSVLVNIASYFTG